MEYIEAPSKPDQWTDPSVFLAGGITDCPPWQWDVADQLQSRLDIGGLIINPRRDDFPIGDPGAARQQIGWEFQMLWEVDIISMWFCDAPSDQPICMYELGAHLSRYMTLLQQAEREGRRRIQPCFEIAIGVEPGYRRGQDVYLQVENVKKAIGDMMDTSCLAINDSLSGHVDDLIFRLDRWYQSIA